MFFAAYDPVCRRLFRIIFRNRSWRSSSLLAVFAAIFPAVACVRAFRAWTRGRKGLLVTADPGPARHDRSKPLSATADAYEIGI